MDGLRAYPAYKDSGVDWLGRVPAHWEVRRIKTLFREKDERSGAGNGILLSLTRSRGIVPQAEASKRIASAEDLSKYKVCRPGDLIMNRMQAWSGMFAVSAYEGVVSPDYCVFGAIGASSVKYFEQLFKTPRVVEQFAQLSKGIGSGFNRLYTPDFGAIPVFAPSLAEQAAIVRFLDHADRRIRRYIRAKRRLIALLNEQKQAIIHRAVTRGLDPNVRLKPSGVEWLGDVPEHWEITPIKRVLSRMDYGTSEAAKTDGKVRLLTMSNIQKGEVVDSGTGGLDRVPPGLLLEKHDLLFTRTNGNPDLVGKVGLFRGSSSEQVTFASYLVRLRVRQPFSACWLHLLLNSSVFWAFARSHALVNLQTNLNPNRYGQFLIPTPPSSEQERIADVVARETSRLTEAMAAAQREITLLQEYRTRLIADVVTGKLDVREAAAKLPDEPVEDEESLDLEDSTEEDLSESEEQSEDNDEN